MVAVRQHSQSPVLPRARLAYDACLNAGSTAVLADGQVCALRIPHSRMVSLTGFAPVISCLKDRRVDWLHHRDKMVGVPGNAPGPGTHLVRFRL